MTGTVIRVDSALASTLLRGDAVRLRAALTTVIHQGGALLQTRVRARASGRPGPRVQTGDYRRGISLERGFAIGSADLPVPYATVFSNSPQGQRLENGFIGIDSRGRTYRQPPLPHWGPASVEVEEIVIQKIDQVVQRIDQGVA